MPRLPRVGRLVVAVLAILMVALGGTALAQAAAPMILLLPGGGWQSEDASSMAVYRDEFAASGYRTRIVVYPLGSVTASIEYADAVAQDERIGGTPVIAYGISAGGTIAAALAAEGRVEGAVNAIGPTDFTTSTSPVGILTMLALGMTEEEKHTASPYWRLNGQATPQLIQCGLLDPVTPYDQCHRYAAAATAYDPDTTLQATLNAHAQWPADRDRARAWVQARWPAPTLKSGREPEPEVQSTRSSEPPASGAAPATGPCCACPQAPSRCSAAPIAPTIPTTATSSWTWSPEVATDGPASTAGLDRPSRPPTPHEPPHGGDRRPWTDISAAP